MVLDPKRVALGPAKIHVASSEWETVKNVNVPMAIARRIARITERHGVVRSIELPPDEAGSTVTFEDEELVLERLATSITQSVSGGTLLVGDPASSGQITTTVAVLIEPIVSDGNLVQISIPSATIFPMANIVYGNEESQDVTYSILAQYDTGITGIMELKTSTAVTSTAATFTIVPADDATSVVITTDIVITSDKLLDHGTINTRSVTVIDVGTDDIETGFTLEARNVAGQTLIFISPDGTGFTAAATHTVLLNGIRDTDGNLSAPFQSSWETA